MSEQNISSGVETTLGGFTAASKSIQTLTSEIARMSKESVDHTAQLLERLRSAKTIEDVVSIQTSYLQQSFTNYAEYTRRFGELFALLPLEMAKSGRAAVKQGAETLASGAEQAGQQAQQNADQFGQAVQTFGQSH